MLCLDKRSYDLLRRDKMLEAEVRIKQFLDAFKTLHKRDMVDILFSQVTQDGVELTVSDIESLLAEIKKLRSKISDMNWEMNYDRQMGA